MRKSDEKFVSLGAAGALIVAIKGQLIVGQGEDDITVFVQRDDDLRPYQVEALTIGSAPKWTLLGTSSGITQSFGLRSAGLKSAAAIRIVDKSRRVRDNSLKASSTPGVSILGVGVRKTRQDGSITVGSLRASAKAASQTGAKAGAKKSSKASAKKGATRSAKKKG